MEFDMPKLNLEQGLRFLLPGLLTLVCLYFYDPELFQSISVPQMASFAVLSLVIGVGIYAIYRQVLYDHLICPMLDGINRRMNEHNYRTWIQKRYEIRSRTDAETLYAGKLRPLFPELNSQIIRLRSALIHYTYKHPLFV